MSQPPPDQDRPPSRPAGYQSSPWPSGNEPMTWPSGPSGNEPPSRPAGNQPSAWPSAGQSSPPPPPSPSPAWPPANEPPPGPGYTYGYARRRPRFGRRFPVRALIVLGLFIAFGFAVRALTGHHHPGVSAAVSPPPGNGLHTGLQEPAGVLGATFTLDAGSGSAYRVTLVTVIDPARGATALDTPGSGKRFVGLVFKIRALSGSLQGEDADNSAVLVGADGQDYPAALNRIAGYTNFHDGLIQVAPGGTVTGAVAVRVPDGVTVSMIQWTALSGFGPRVAWTVNG